MTIDDRTEWLEADGLGGFASGTVAGIRTRRYHGILLSATAPPAGRMMLVNGFDAIVATPEGTWPLTSQRYAPGIIHPDGWRRIVEFAREPWPTWSFSLEDGTRIVHELFVPKGLARTVLSWRLDSADRGVRLAVRPFLSGRDYHALHRQNPAFDFGYSQVAGRVVWRPYPGVPAVATLANATFEPAPEWYRQFLYEEEGRRGLDDIEDLATPGLLHFDLSAGEALCVLGTEEDSRRWPPARDLPAFVAAMRAAERGRRARLGGPLLRAADDYLVARGEGTTIVAGYPWFTDWGRDTFIAMRGLCLAAGRFDDARRILLAWSDAVSDGMLPNRFADSGEAREFNAVDASLWYVVAAGEFLSAARASTRLCSAPERGRIEDAIASILSGYAAGTRHRIHLDEDGLIAAGEPGQQLTWMDARVGSREITPRIGKPVEVQALWLNALSAGARGDGRWADVFRRGLETFRSRFWNNDDGCLYDVIDVDHERGRVDRRLRPNQILAVGGLPLSLLDTTRARLVVDGVEARLLTPMGLRSLSPDEPDFVGRYEGGPASRDAAYHQGTVWPWLMGPFVEAWLRVRGNTPDARDEARRRFIQPLLQHTGEAGLGHLSEIADGDAPFAPKGCPFQAWSLGELIRLEMDVLQATRPHHAHVTAHV